MMKNEIETRKAAAVKRLILVGESRFASDLIEASGKEAFETLEYYMRERLKGPAISKRWTNAIANAIVECQLIPTAK